MRKAVQGNSTTARQLVNLGLASGIGGGVGYSYDHSLTGAGMGAVLFQMARGRINQSVARRVGEMLASDDPGVYKRALEMVQKSKGISQFIQSITRQGVAAALPTVMNQLQSNRRQMQ